MKILITGGAGFIGFHLAKHLLETSDAELVLVDNFQRGRVDEDFQKVLDDRRVKLLQLDLTDSASYEKLGSGYDHVYHLAAMNGTKVFYERPHDVLRTNTLSLIYVLDWFAKVNQKEFAGAGWPKYTYPTPHNLPLGGCSGLATF